MPLKTEILRGACRRQTSLFRPNNGVCPLIRRHRMIAVAVVRLAAWLALAGSLGVAGAASEATLRVADPYIELHTGPGAAYPVTYVLERGMSIRVLRRRTDWFEIAGPAGHRGWADREQMLRTLDPAGLAPRLDAPGLADFQLRRRELGAQSGDFDGASVIHLYGGYAFTDNLSAELGWSEVLGRFSSSRLVKASLVHQPFPQWRVSPFVTLGVGRIEVRPAATLVQSEDRNDNFHSVGLGLRAYLARRFLLRFDYRHYVVLTSRDDNEEPGEWTLGFGFFF